MNLNSGKRGDSQMGRKSWNLMEREIRELRNPPDIIHIVLYAAYLVSTLLGTYVVLHQARTIENQRQTIRQLWDNCR